MVTGHSISPRPLYASALAPPGTPVSIAARHNFIAALLKIAPDTRALWLPIGTETTTSLDRSRNARTLTYSATFASQYAVLGSGLTASFDGSTDDGSYPDAANLTFGNSVVDSPFSIFAWLNVTSSAAIKDILTKLDLTTGSTKREWTFFVSAADKLNLVLHDESVPATIGRLYNTAITTGANIFVCGTYSGSGAASGIKLYVATSAVALAQLDDTGNSAGAYVAMEDLAATVRLGDETGAAATGNFFSGTMGSVGLVANELNLDELKALVVLGNGYYGLSLL